MNNPNAQYANQRPMQGVADQMATHGRYGDSMMVHMNPVEVAGLASLSPTGSLTTNPVTGQPEAFLPFLAPLLGSIAGSTFLTGAGSSLIAGGLSSAAAGAIGSGLATTALTGDLKQGIMSGLTGYGIGTALQGASAALDPAVVDATADLASSADELASLKSLADTGASTTADIARSQALNAPISTPMPSGQVGAPAPNFESIAYKADTLADATSQAGANIGQNFADKPLDFAGQFGKELMSTQSILPIAVGEGARAGEMLSDDMRAAGRKRQAEKDAELADAYARRDYAVEMARKDTALNNPYTGAYGYNQGGLTSINPQDYMRQRNNLENMGRAPVQMFEGGGLPYDIGRFNFNRGNAVDTQRSVRPPRVVTGAELEAESAAMVAEGRDPRAGFGAEKVYFRQPLPKENTGGDTGTGTPPAPPNTGPSKGGRTPSGPTKGGNNILNAKTPNLEVETVLRDNALRAGRGAFDANDAERALRDSSAREAGALVTGIGSEDLRRSFASDYGDLTVPIYNRNEMANGGIVSLAEGQSVPSLSPSMGSEGMEMNIYPNQPPRQMDAPQMSQEEIMSVISEVKAIAKADPDGSRGDPQRYQELTAKLQQIRAQIGDDAMASLINSVPQEQALPPGSMFAEGGMTPQGDESRLLEQVTQAILGQLPSDQAEVVINMFVDTYGSEVFAQLRDTVLQSVVPNAQTEGKIEGQGGGMDDEVMGMIGNQQPVAVSPDEYIVPADVVSGIGDGSSSAGAEQLDEMLDRVRSTRTGTTRQPAPIQAKQGGVLPA